MGNIHGKLRRNDAIPWHAMITQCDKRKVNLQRQAMATYRPPTSADEKRRDTRERKSPWLRL